METTDHRIGRVPHELMSGEKNRLAGKRAERRRPILAETLIAVKRRSGGDRIGNRLMPIGLAAHHHSPRDPRHFVRQRDRRG
jgi:hypothetical protein